MSPTRYNEVAIAVHWLTALAIVIQFALGWTMISLRAPSALHFALHQWHKSIGITLLALSVLRLIWRLLHRPPSLPATMPVWEKRMAKVNQAMLYFLLLALPISGWALVSASPLNIPTVLYGVLPLPHLPVLADLPDKRAAQQALKAIHEVGGWILALLLAGHVGAALRHHFLLRDETLVRMLPRSRLPKFGSDGVRRQFVKDRTRRPKMREFNGWQPLRPSCSRSGRLQAHVPQRVSSISLAARFRVEAMISLTSFASSIARAIKTAPVRRDKSSIAFPRRSL